MGEYQHSVPEEPIRRLITYLEAARDASDRCIFFAPLGLRFYRRLYAKSLDSWLWAAAEKKCEICMAELYMTVMIRRPDLVPILAAQLDADGQASYDAARSRMSLHKTS